MPLSHFKLPPSRVALAVCAWLVAAGLGSAMLLNYETAPGLDRGAPARWPDGSHIMRDSGTPTLLVFIHPECPCSRASLGELARLLAQCPGRARVCVLMLDVDGLPQDAAETPIWRAAAPIPLAILDLRMPQMDGLSLARAIKADPSLLATMLTALDRGDGRALVEAAHSLKGSSAQFGAHRMEELCGRLEKAGRSGLLGDAREAHAAAEVEFRAVLAALETEVTIPAL